MITGDWTEQTDRGLMARNQKTLNQLPDQQINRIMVCGKCPTSGIDPKFVTELFRKGVEQLFHRVEVYREYGYDPEVSRIKRLKRGVRWREKNRDIIREKRSAVTRNQKISQLKELLEN